MLRRVSHLITGATSYQTSLDLFEHIKRPLSLDLANHQLSYPPLCGTFGIRLLEIRISHSLDDQTPVRARLVAVRAENPETDWPDFNALSYMWGNDSADCTLFLNDCAFKVRKNLYEALKTLRYRKLCDLKCRESPQCMDSLGDYGTIRLWVDAICINQQDTKERNHQVQLMKWIYMRANAVMVWLTEPTNHPPETKRFRIKGPGKQDIEDRKLDKWRELCYAPYWKRAWIIQEIGLANMLDFNSIHGSLGEEELSVLCPETSPAMEHLHRRINREYEYRTPRFHELLKAHRHSSCHDLRDRIYALVSLAISDIPDAADFPFNYSGSLSEVFVDIVIWRSDLEESRARCGSQDTVDSSTLLYFFRDVGCALGLLSSKTSNRKDIYLANLPRLSETERARISTSSARQYFFNDSKSLTASNNLDLEPSTLSFDAVDELSDSASLYGFEHINLGTNSQVSTSPGDSISTGYTIL